VYEIVMTTLSLFKKQMLSREEALASIPEFVKAAGIRTNEAESFENTIKLCLDTVPTSRPTLESLLVVRVTHPHTCRLS
jgi:hypothetical protein